MAKAYCNRGFTYWIMGKFEPAMRDNAKALELEPKLAPAYFNRAANWLRVEAWDEARADFLTAIQLGMDVSSAFSGRFLYL